MGQPIARRGFPYSRSGCEESLLSIRPRAIARTVGDKHLLAVHGR